MQIMTPVIMSPKQTKMASDGLKKKKWMCFLNDKHKEKNPITIMPVKSFYVKITHTCQKINEIVLNEN